ncbi:hypothetical protein P4V86_03290 [Brevibacillus laterosporus]|uniref:hypothetical protein n=1 Tax=Brevibacillus laterosporus TaxID=1465 RepID=UPI00036A3E03|nr:hypothetical protein [Brevibacillus laterosporus]ATO48548.1 hypothetical protein BrL25_05125 [Brevibacillus laterosporus DSM 25]MED2002382.1 hypothetical protein [Brevibacillus laterosporus]
MTPILEINKGFSISDARNLPEGNWFKEKGYFMQGKPKSYTPIHVYLKEQDLRLYFWFDHDFSEWFRKYLTLTGDYEGNALEIYGMYSEQRVKELNKHEANLGDKAIEKSYSYTLGGRKFYFVERFVNVKVEVLWRKGGY